MALALYRKYRPATFAEVVGQDHVTQPLRIALAAGRINHAYLFSGPRGCGKTSSARIMARSLNCVEGPTPDPCGVCPSCIALAPEGPGSLDVVELDAASHGGVDDTRDLRDRAFYMPAESRYRVFIIDEAHMVSAQGFNALLKIVEEPPEHLVFIFATTEPDKVMTTIRSRTHHYPFRLIPPATLRKLLEKLCAEEQVTVEPAVFPLVIQAGGGSARDSLSILDQLLAGAGPDGVTYQHAVALLGVTDAALLDETVDALAADDGASVFGAIDKVVEAGHDPRRFAADLLQRLRDLVILAAVPDAGAKGLIDAPEDQLAAMYGQSERLGAGTLTRLAELLHTGLTDMRGTTAPRLALELMCARMLLPAASGGEGALVQRVERLEKFAAGGGGVPLPAISAAAAADPPADAADAGGKPATRTGSGYRRPSSRSDAAIPAPAATSGPVASAGSVPPAPAASVLSPASAGTVPPPAPAASVPPVRAGAVPATAAPVSPPPGGALGLPPPPVLSRSRPASQAKATPARPAPAETKAPTAPPAAQTASPPVAVSMGGEDDWLPPDAPPDEEEYGDPLPQPGRPQPAADLPRPAASTAGRPPTGGRTPLISAPPSPPPAPPPVSPVRPVAAPAASTPAGTPAPATVPEAPRVAAAEVASTGQPGIGVTDARRVWPEILAAVQRRRRAAYALFASSTVLDLSANVLLLSMPSAGMAKRVNEPGYANLLREALKEVLGVDWAIRCEAATDATPSSRPSLSLVPNPTTESEDDTPEDYDARAPDTGAGAYVVRDPEQAAIELLATQLGAKRIDS